MVALLIDGMTQLDRVAAEPPYGDVLMGTNPDRIPKVAILGAGCAGTLLAAELRRRHFAGRIELLDARTDFTREQRWCFWRKRGEAEFGLPISAEWPSWQVADRQRTVRRSAASYVYSHVYAPEFFRRFHGPLAEDGRTTLHLGCRVAAVQRHGGVPRVQTDRGELSADVVIDARHESVPAYALVTESGPNLLWQTFRGRLVKLTTPRFDPAAATLMDFHVRAPGAGLAFAYVLPFTRTCALVEAVVLADGKASRPRLDAILDAYLEERLGEHGETLAAEEGALPMTTDPFTRPNGAEIISLGVGGGAARPSSGYAFTNMVRAARQTAAALCAGRPLRQPQLAWKYRGLDTLLLRLLGTEPAATRRAFMEMFTKVESERLVRFLSETSSWRDDLALVAALPKAAFLKTAAAAAMDASVRCLASGASRRSMHEPMLSIPHPTAPK